MTQPRPLEYFLIRVAPDPIRNEWINVGVALFDPAGEFAGVRIVDDWQRVRRRFPRFDPRDLQGLAGDLANKLRAGDDRGKLLHLADETFSLALQFSPRAGVLTADPAAELERLYRHFAAPPDSLSRLAAGARAGLRRALRKVFVAEGVAGRLRPVAAADLGSPGDRYRFDFHYRNGGHHCLQPLPLGGDDGPVRDLCFTVQRLRRHLDLHATAFARSPAEGERLVFQRGLLDEAGIRLRYLADAPAVAAEVRLHLGLGRLNQGPS